MMGIQGCGKGTQAELLEQHFGWRHINIGNLFRSNIERQTELGKEASKYTEKGELVPDELVYEVIKDAIRKADKGLILDGFPRNLAQHEFLVENVKIDKVFLLDLDTETAIKRISSRRHCENCKRDYNLLYNKPKEKGVCDDCGGNLVQRKDDNEEAVALRIEKFYQETGKVIDLYRKQNKLISINADQGIQEIHRQILAELSC